MERGDLAAPEQPRLMSCPRCFANIPVGSPSCPECGAPVGEGYSAPSDASPELAKANLSRLRGDFRAAREQLLSILRRYPNSAPAHEMMGDVYEDDGDLDQAAQWYELALDLAPDMPGLQQKQDSVVRRLAEMERERAESSIGMLRSWPSWTPYAFLVGGVMIAILAAYAFINRNGVPKSQVETTIVAPQDGDPPPSPSASASPTPSLTPAPASVPVVRSDADALAKLQKAGLTGGKFAEVLSDPRKQSLNVTVDLGNEDDARLTCGNAVKLVFESFPACEVVLIRGAIQGELKFVADAARTAYSETLTDDWKQKNPDPDAWLGHILQSEWKPK